MQEEQESAQVGCSRVARPSPSGLAARGGGQPSSEKDDCHCGRREAATEQNSAYGWLEPAPPFSVAVFAASSRTKSPLLPPLLRSSRTWSITIARSTALHMS